MNNIEKLAIEKMIYEHTGFNPNVADDAETIKHIKNLLKSFAKALQSSEPVAECIASGSGHSIGKHGQDGGLACEWCGQEFTLPPASVPLEKYNKLLDDLKEVRIDVSDLHADENKEKLMNRLISVRFGIDQAIAEAEALNRTKDFAAKAAESTGNF